MKKRVYEISVLNVLFALLVIFIHVSSQPVTVLDRSGLPYMAVMTLWRLSSFVVQGFIFLSGFKMFYNMKEEFSLKKFYLSKIKNIFLPYVLWVAIFYFYLLYRGFLPEHSSFSAIVRHIFVGDLVGHFYFIPVIMQFYLLAPLWNVLAKNVKPTSAIALSLIIMIFCSAAFKTFVYNDRIFTTYLFYFVAGIYAGTKYEKFIALLKKYFRPILAIFTAAAIANTALSYLNFVGIKQINCLEYIHIIYCIAAVFFCYGAALKFSSLAQNRFVSAIDRASYYIYLAHPLFIFMIDGYMAEKGISAVRYTYPVRIIFVYAITILLCVGYTRIKSRKKT